MKKTITSLFLLLGIASVTLLFASCAYFESAKAPEAPLASTPSVTPSDVQPQDAVVVEEVEAVEVVAPVDQSVAPSASVPVVEEEYEVDAVAVEVPAVNTAIPPADTK